MRSERDRGSVSLYLVIFALAVLVLLGFLVDGGQYMNAREQAADIAQQAARAAVDQVDIGALRQGNFTVPQSACDQQAAALVRNYAGNDVSVSLADCFPGGLTAGGRCDRNQPPGVIAPCVAVTVDVTVNPAIPVGPFGNFTAEVQETATLDCGNQIEQTGFC